MNYDSIIKSIKENTINELKCSITDSYYNKFDRIDNYFVNLSTILLNIVDNKININSNIFLKLSFCFDILVFLLNESAKIILIECDSKSQLSLLNLHSKIINKIYKLLEDIITNDNKDIIISIFDLLNSDNVFDLNIDNKINKLEEVNILLLKKITIIKKNLIIILNKLLLN